MIICKICGKEFEKLSGLSTHVRIHNITSKEYYDKYLKKNGEGICMVCKNNTSYISISDGYFKYCSFKCSNNSDIVQENKKRTYLKNYGVDHPSKSKLIKERKKKTCLKNYGVDNPRKSKKIQHKYRETCLKKYGVDNYSKTEDGKKILRILKLEKIQIQYKLKEPIQPTIGRNERKCLNELQKYCDFKIERNPQIIGYFPDGYIDELDLVIEFDERYHFTDEWITYRKYDIDRERSLKNYGKKIFRIKEIEWNNDRLGIIKQFQKKLKKV